MSRSNPPEESTSPLARTVKSPGGGVPSDADPTTEVENAGSDAPVEPPPRDGGPARVDRYVVIDKLGEGGFGTVYRGYDPKLDRFVALKVVHVGGVEGDPVRDDRRARALREARTLARLDHPNVVPVYDAGTVDADVFIAMALAPGETLARWLAQKKRSVREILGAYVAAGTGLAAAHEAGVVHRDFKPENVVVADDGAVRVLDFGLARIADDRAPAEDRGASPSPDPSLYTTRTGERFGTPAYMAPEQHLDRPCDARADQFSFAVAVWRALAGEHPFAGGNLVELARSVTEGKLQAMPSQARVPQHVVRALTRALGVDPEKRFPSMRELLAELERDPGRAGLRVGAAIATLAAVAVAIALVDARSSRAPSCAAGDAAVTDVWNAAGRAKVKAAFDGSGRSYAADTFDRVARRLDEYTSAWSRAQENACEAKRSGALSPAKAADTEQCLDGRARELRALVDVLAAGTDAGVVDKAIGATDRLTSIDDCKEPSRAAAHVQRPQDPALRAKVDDILARLADARGRGLFGKPQSEATGALLEEARRTSYAPLVSVVAYFHGGELVNAIDYPGAEDAYREAMRESARAGNAPRWFASLGALGSTLALTRKSDEVVFYVPILENLVDMAGDDRSLAAYTLANLAQIEDTLGHNMRAADFSLRAADMLEAIGTPKERQTSFFQRLLGGRGLMDAGRYLDGVDIFSRALGPIEQEYGEHHQLVAYALKSRGFARALVWQFDGARDDARRAEEIYTEIHGADAASVGDGVEVEGVADTLAARWDDAKTELSRARELRAKAFGEDSALAANDDCNLAGVYLGTGEIDEALRVVKQCYALLAKAYVKDHPDLDTAMESVAAVDLRMGNLDEAQAMATQALADRRGRSGEEPIFLAPPLTRLARVALLRGRFAEARAGATEALAQLEGKQPSPGDPVDALCTVAEAAMRSGDVPAALDALGRARGILAPLVAADHPTLLHVARLEADAALAGGDVAKSAALYDAVVPALAARGGDPEDLLRARFGQAKTRWETGARDDARREASEVMRAAGAKDVYLAGLAGEAREWLRGR